MMESKDRAKAMTFVSLGTVACVGGMFVQLYLDFGFNALDSEWWRAVIGYWKANKVFHPGLLDALKRALLIWGSVAFSVMLFASWRWSWARTDYGSARWARPSELKSLGLTAKKGFVLGKAGGKILTFDKYYASAAWAAPGAGKTQGLTKPSIFRAGSECSLVVNDPSGELCDETAGHRNKLGEVFRIDWASPTTDRWNPLEELPEDLADLQTEIAGIWFDLLPRNQKGDAQFDDLGRSLGIAATMYLVLDARRQGVTTSFGEVYHWISEGASQDQYLDSDDPLGAFLIERAAQAEELGWPRVIATTLRDMAGTSRRERSGYINMAKRGMEPWSNAHVVNATQDSTFSIGDLRGKNEKPITIYLCIREKDLETFGVISRIFLTQVMRFLLSQTKREAEEGKEIGFILDETPALGPMPKVVLDGPARGRKLRIRFMFISQDPAQFRAIYGEDGLDTIMTVCQYMVIYHQRHAKVQKQLSDLVGQRTRLRKTLADDPLGRQTKRMEKSLEGAALIRPEDIGALGEGECFILAPHATNRPVYAKAAWAFKEREFKKAGKIPAPAF